MRFLEKALLGVLAVTAAVLIQTIQHISESVKPPKSEIDEYWGAKNKSNYKENAAIKTFKINYKQEVIDKLKVKLGESIVYQEPLENVGFEYGFNSKELTKIVKYWKDTYLKNWDSRQNYLNKYPQFKTQIQGLDIHYIHVKPKVSANVKVVPILLLHGWPGSVREFYELIPQLTNKSEDKEFVFEVIVPSLPGYGFSQGSAKSGFGAVEMAVVMRNLMIRLGHNKFVIHGGDWGSLVGSNIASIFPEQVIGYHSNTCHIGSPLSWVKAFVSAIWPKHFVGKDHKDFFYPLMPKLKFLLQESGYFHLQATKPDTIGNALTQNPAGLAGYILEKFSTWTNPCHRYIADGGLYNDFTKEALLDNVMIYYLTNSITTSIRLYSETFSTKGIGYRMDRVPTNTPTGCVRFRNDIWHHFDWQLEEKYTKIIHSTFKQDGGHFPALQLPTVLYQDIVAFVRRLKF